MENKQQYIIDKIKNESRANADALILRAREKCNDDLLQAKNETEQARTAAIAELETNLRDLTEQKIKVASLEIRKNNLAEKQKILEQTFIDVKSDLIKMKNKDYLDLISKLIKANIKDVHTVVISKDDEKRITDAFVKTLSTTLKVKLVRTVSNESFGGVILQSHNFDKSLTFDKLLRNLRYEIESEVARIIFE